LWKYNPQFQELEKAFRDTAMVFHKTYIKQLIGYCPTFIKTRWLSRLRTLNWIISRERQILNIKLSNVKPQDREEYQHLSSPDNFLTVKTYAILITPFD
jgi:hypothetical protein